MATAFLYLASVLIWGSTWIAITFQLGRVHPMYSIAYRFIIASLVLLIVALIKNRAWPRFSLYEHLVLLFQGIFMFCLNYIGFYFAAEYIVSGLVAVVFSSIIFFNIMMGALLFKIHIRLPVALGAFMGCLGIVTIFSQDVQTLKLGDRTFLGILYGLCATFSASCGNMLSTYLQKRGCSVLEISTVSMGYGALITMCAGQTLGVPLVFDCSPNYILSLLYLAIIGSSLAFWCYLTLLGKIGPDKAAYALVGTPVIALVISVFCEGLQWGPHASFGIALVLGGSMLVLWRCR